MSIVFYYHTNSDDPKTHVVHRSSSDPSPDTTFFKKDNVLLVIDEPHPKFQEEAQKFIERLESYIPGIVSQRNFAQDPIPDTIASHEPIFEAMERINFEKDGFVGKGAHVTIMIGPHLFGHSFGISSIVYHSSKALGLCIVGKHRDKSYNRKNPTALDELFLTFLNSKINAAGSLLRLSMLRDPEEKNSAIWLHTYDQKLGNRIITVPFHPVDRGFPQIEGAI